MHDPMLLTDEYAAEIQDAYNIAFDKLYTMLAIPTGPPQLSLSSVRILAHCTWRAMPWCVLDNIAHTIHPHCDSDGIIEPLPGRWQWICNRHDKAITRRYIDIECEDCGPLEHCTC